MSLNRCLPPPPLLISWRGPYQSVRIFLMGNCCFSVWILSVISLNFVCNLIVIVLCIVSDKGALDPETY